MVQRLLISCRIDQLEMDCTSCTSWASMSCANARLPRICFLFIVSLHPVVASRKHATEAGMGVLCFGTPLCDFGLPNAFHRTRASWMHVMTASLLTSAKRAQCSIAGCDKADLCMTSESRRGYRMQAAQRPTINSVHEPRPIKSLHVNVFRIKKQTEILLTFFRRQHHLGKFLRWIFICEKRLSEKEDKVICRVGIFCWADPLFGYRWQLGLQLLRSWHDIRRQYQAKGSGLWNLPGTSQGQPCNTSK